MIGRDPLYRGSPCASTAPLTPDANREMVVTDLATKDDPKSENASVRGGMGVMKQERLALIEHQTLRLIVGFGIMLAASLGLMTAIIGVLLRFHRSYDPPSPGGSFAVRKAGQKRDKGNWSGALSV